MSAAMIAIMTALAADQRDLMWGRDDTCASVSDIEAVAVCFGSEARPEADRKGGRGE